MNITKLLFFIGAVICLPLYGFLCLTNLDPVTGFFASKSVLTVGFYSVLFFIPALILIFTNLLKRELDFSIANSKVLSILSILLGGAMIAGCVTHIMRLLSSGTFLTILQIPLSIISGVVFLRLGFSYLHENISNRGSFTFIFPVIWALITCIEMFRDYPQIAGMPERTLYLLCLLCFTLFLVGQSRILSDVDLAKGVRWSSSFGLCAGLFGLTMSIGEVAAHPFMTLPVFDAALAFILSLYCVAFAINANTAKK